MNSKKVLGALLVIGGLYLIISNSILFYNYSLPHLLFFYRHPDAVIGLYLISGVIGIICGIKILKEDLSIKKAYLFGLGFYQCIVEYFIENKIEYNS